MTATTVNAPAAAGALSEPISIVRDRKSLFILTALLIIVGVVAAQNMFQFPYYQDSEGTSLANGWALVTTGNLSPYTYAYEEAPIGTFIMGIWLALTGSLTQFGFTVNTGRVLMLILHLLTTALIYGITRKLSRSDLAATFATLIFAFSPLATVLQRRVLLDNMMVVIYLFSFYLVIGESRTLGHYITSAFAFGTAVLTKGAAFFFLPAFIYTIRLRAHPHHRRFAVALWLALTLFLLSFYPLYAQMKQELFPQGFFLGGDFPHVSLIERLGNRGPETGRFLNMASGLPESFRTWIELDNAFADPVLIYGGFIALLFVLLMSLDNKGLRPLIAMALGYGLYLLFGGQIFDSAAITLLPILAIAVGIVLGGAVQFISRHVAPGIFRIGAVLIALAMLLYPFVVFYSNRLGIYTINQVDEQIKAVQWVEANVSREKVIITDNYAFVELRQHFPNTHHYWKIDTDPAVKYNILDDDLCNIDYVIATPQVYEDTRTFKLDLMRRVVENSNVLINYQNNGWPIEIRQVNKVNCQPKPPAGPAPIDEEPEPTSPQG